MSKVNALSDEGLFSWSIPSFDEREGRSCVVNDCCAMMIVLLWLNLFDYWMDYIEDDD